MKAAADELTNAEKGGDGDRGGRCRIGEEGEPDRERRRDEDEEEAWIFFFFYTRSAREEGNVDNAVREGGGGISMVHWCGLKNLLMVKVRALELLKLRTARKSPTKDRPTLYVETCTRVSTYFQDPDG